MADQQGDQEKNTSSKGGQRRIIRVDPAHVQIAKPWFLIRGKDRPDER